MSQFSARFYNGPMTPIDFAIDLADRQRFALAALPVKLRELEQACLDEEEATARRARVKRECDQLMIEAVSNFEEMKRRLYSP